MNHGKRLAKNSYLNYPMHNWNLASLKHLMKHLSGQDGLGNRCAGQMDSRSMGEAPMMMTYIGVHTEVKEKGGKHTEQILQQ